MLMEMCLHGKQFHSHFHCLHLRAPSLVAKASRPVRIITYFPIDIISWNPLSSSPYFVYLILAVTTLTMSCDLPTLYKALFICTK